MGLHFAIRVCSSQIQEIDLVLDIYEFSDLIIFHGTTTI